LAIGGWICFWFVLIWEYVLNKSLAGKTVKQTGKKRDDFEENVNYLARRYV